MVGEHLLRFLLKKFNIREALLAMFVSYMTRPGECLVQENA